MRTAAPIVRVDIADTPLELAKASRIDFAPVAPAVLLACLEQVSRIDSVRVQILCEPYCGSRDYGREQEIAEMHVWLIQK